MTWQIQVDEEVLVQAAEGHSLPPVLEGLELPALAIVKREGIDEAHGDLWWVQIKPPFEGPEVQVHADQLRRTSCPECGSERGTHKIDCKKARADREAASGKEPAAGWTSDAMLATLLKRTVVSAGSGVLGLALKDDGSWVVSAEYGHEAEDSPMVGAATYGTGDLRRALMRAGADAGLWMDDGSPEPAGRQQRILIVEAEHPAELNVKAVQGSMSMLADADEAYAFSGDKAVCIKHREFDVSEDAFQVAVAIQRCPAVEDLDPETTLTHRGRTIGAHIGIPLAHAEALRDAVKIEHGTDEQKRLAAEALAEITDFVAAETKS